jgi:uncharacterized membrane protein
MQSDFWPTSVSKRLIRLWHGEMYGQRETVTDVLAAICNKGRWKISELELITNFIEQNSSWKANIVSAYSAISSPSVQPDKSQPLRPVLSYLNLVFILTTYFFKIHFNIILSPMPLSLKQVSRLIFRPNFTFTHVCYNLYPYHPRFDHHRSKLLAYSAFVFRSTCSIISW